MPAAHRSCLLSKAFIIHGELPGQGSWDVWFIWLNLHSFQGFCADVLCHSCLLGLGGFFGVFFLHEFWLHINQHSIWGKKCDLKTQQNRASVKLTTLPLISKSNFTGQQICASLLLQLDFQFQWALSAEKKYVNSSANTESQWTPYN